jgi:two-component system sensor histidine kinase KdpD
MDTNDPTVQQLEREARVVGLREVSMPTLETVERRRLQLWGLTVMLLLAVSVGVAVITTWRPGVGLVTPSVLRFAIVLVSIAFGVYATEKELHLRRLVRLLTDQRVLTTALTNRLTEMGLLLEAGRAMTRFWSSPPS